MIYSPGRFLSPVGKEDEVSLRFLPATAIVILMSLPLQLMAEPVKVPQNPSFTEYLRERAALKSNLLKAEEARFTGLIPSPHATAPKPKAIPEVSLEATSLPATYDLRQLDRVTPAGNQLDCGVCWAFATNGALETANMPKLTSNFSEQHMIMNSGFDVNVSRCDDGGNVDMALAYLTRWSGPVLDSQSPYNPVLLQAAPAVRVVRHVFDVDLFDFEMNKIKRAIMTKGAIYTTMQYYGKFYDSTNHSYYNDGSYAQLKPTDDLYNPSPNHAVVIVGWDDTYSKSNFSSPAPPEDGAFIVKNSWGPEWGENGYFYVSYHDQFIGQGNASFSRVFSASAFDRIYSYDKLGWTASWTCGSGSVWGGNVFAAALSGGEQLMAIGFYTAGPDVTVEYSIYTSLESIKKPAGGTLAQNGSSVFASKGYHTIILPEAVSLDYKQTFSVVLKYTQTSTPSEAASLPAETIIDGYSSAASAAGRSFVSCDGATWAPFTAWDEANTNLSIKAYTQRK